MAPGGIKPRPPKRIHAELPTNARVTRSNKRLLLDVDASPQSEGVSDPKHQTPIAIQKPSVSVPEDEETVPNFDNNTHGPCSYEESRERGSILEKALKGSVDVGGANCRSSFQKGVRGHVPVSKHWKDYKDPDGNVREGILQNFVGKVGNKFEMDVQAVPIRKACTQMLKGAIHQQRYRLKQKYFDPFLLNLVTKTSPVRSMTDEQWNELVESWKDPKKWRYVELKNNRAQVKFHQTTGSRSYPVHCDNLGDKYKDKEPTALDLFKECHYSSKKKGYTDDVQAAIVEMEKSASQPTEDGQQSNSAAKVVAEVLTKHTRKPMFLKHVGVQHVHERSSRSDREAEQEAQKRGTAKLQARVETLTNQLKESEEARIRQEEARIKQEEETKKKQAEMEAKLDFLLNQITPSELKSGSCVMFDG
ncbi:hypothetical protein VPH35_077750 [Triticum aestivum]